MRFHRGGLPATLSCPDGDEGYEHGRVCRSIVQLVAACRALQTLAAVNSKFTPAFAITLDNDGDVADGPIAFAAQGGCSHDHSGTGFSAANLTTRAGRGAKSGFAIGSS